ncbi:MAG: SMP-30/gluconolactonase/LRE family protein [Planctomycetota bacterium]
MATRLMAGSIVDSSAPLKKLPLDVQLADGAAWTGSQLIVPDVKAGKVLRHSPVKRSITTMNVGAAKVSGTFFQAGKLYLTDNPQCRILVQSVGGPAETLVQLPDGHRPNDLAVDDDGNVFVTLTKQNQVWLIEPDGSASILIDGIETPNGIILSPDQQSLYVSEFRPRRVVVASLHRDSGRLRAESPRELGVMDPDPELKGGGDGMAVDRAGNVYCAGADGVSIWSPSGVLLSKIETPSRPINCVFGDRDGRTLYISCIDGVYAQRMNAYGCAPRPVMALPDGVNVISNLVYGSDGDRKLRADVFTPPADVAQRAAVVVVHGGGWLNGDKTKFWVLAAKLAQRGYVAMSVEYRLGYEAKFPAAVRDVHAAIRYLRTQAEPWDFDPKRIVALGGSAGGHLVGLVGTTPDIPELTGAVEGDASSKLSGVVVMAGPMAMVSGSVAMKSTPEPPVSNAEVWLGETITDARELYLQADALEQLNSSSPSYLFLCGELDQPERNQPARDRLKAMGIDAHLHVMEDGKHGCWMRPPWTDDVIDQVDRFSRSIQKP